MKPAKADYLASLSAELESQQRRVRQLIGNAHWGHDGRHKELLLTDTIRRHCPSSILVSTGFIVSPSNFDIRSSEQDILVVDCRKEAPIFQQGGLIVVSPATVIAAISVKTKLTNEPLKSVVAGLKTVRDVMHNTGLNQQMTWCAGFFYDVDASWICNSSLIYENLRCQMEAHRVPSPVIDDGFPMIGGPNFIGTSAEIALVIDYERIEKETATTLRGYNCGSLSTAVFLACLLEHIAVRFDSRPAAFSDIVTDLNMPALDPASVRYTC